MRFAVILCLAACCLSVPCNAASTPERAARLQDAGDFAAASRAWREIVEADRFDLPRSADALLRWVACCQAGRADPAVAAEFAGHAARLLEQPPTLDGAAAVNGQAARESLLWKAWGGQPALTLAVSKSGTASTNSNGRVERKWVLGLDAVYDKGYVLRPWSGTVIEVLTAEAQRDDGRQVASEAYLGMLIDEGRNRSFFNLVFPLQEIDARRCVALRGTVRVTQASSWTITPVALKAGEGWNRRSEALAITGFRREDGYFKVLCSARSLVPAPAVEADPAGSTAGGPAARPMTPLDELRLRYTARGQWIPADTFPGYWDKDDIENYWLEGAQGVRIRPRTVYRSDDVMGLWFPGDVQPASLRLMSCERSAPTAREFPVAASAADIAQIGRR